jgi:Chaperone of endosialidase
MAGYNNANLASELFALNNNRYGDIIHTTGAGYVKIIGKDNLGQSVLVADQGKLSINHISTTGNTQLNLWENDSSSFCRILMRTLTQSPNHYWNIAATSNVNLSSERFNFYNNRYGNILSLSGNGVVAINRDPVSVANTDAALQVKQIGNRDGIKLEHANNSNNWTWYVNNTNNDLDMYYNGSYKGSFSNASGMYTASDRKLKKNISPIAYGLSNILKLEPVAYSMKNDENNQQVMGFVAQEVEKLFPEIVKEIALRDGTTYKAMNYDAIGVLAIKAIQEQQNIIEDQQKTITFLLEEVKAIKQQLNK